MSPPIDLSRCTEEELWRFVGEHLSSRGVEAVLVGGAVVAVYSRGAYRSGDLDFVELRSGPRSIQDVLAEIGFHRQGRHYVHADCAHLFIEFVRGPLGIGDDTSIQPDRLPLGAETLLILSPTDCVRDRLASYIHFDARECLDQAALVARSHAIDWQRVGDWCRAEGPRGPAALAGLRRLLDTPSA